MPDARAADILEAVQQELLVGRTNAEAVQRLAAESLN
jgi:hypothetical protein